MVQVATELRSRTRRRLGELDFPMIIWNHIWDIFRLKLLTMDPFPSNCDYVAELLISEARDEIQAEMEQINHEVIWAVRYPFNK